MSEVTCLPYPPSPIRRRFEGQLADEEATRALGRTLAAVARPGLTIALNGPLGAGKTTLVKALAEALGADPSVVSSPTFSLIHEYEAAIPLAHFDAYRLEDGAALEAAGGDDYLGDARWLCLVEWADKVADRLPETRWELRLEPGRQPWDGRRFWLDIPWSDPAAMDWRLEGFGDVQQQPVDERANAL